jgi:tetratricopeptide (TPR) repeat protein
MRIVLCLHLAVLGGALSCFFFAPAAFAQTPVADAPVPPLAETLVGDAKQDYDAGKSLFEAGDYAGALSKFQSASRASGDPRLFWNQAVCERAMQHYARAIALVHRYPRLAFTAHRARCGTQRARLSQRGRGAHGSPRRRGQ